MERDRGGQCRQSPVDSVICTGILAARVERIDDAARALGNLAHVFKFERA
jgi:hypothetical protein